MNCTSEPDKQRPLLQQCSLSEIRVEAFMHAPLSLDMCHRICTAISIVRTFQQRTVHPAGPTGDRRRPICCTQCAEFRSFFFLRSIDFSLKFDANVLLLQHELLSQERVRQEGCESDKMSQTKPMCNLDNATRESHRSHHTTHSRVRK